MAGHNVDEARYYTSQGLNSSADFDEFVAEVFPFSFPAAQSYVEDVLYPASSFTSTQDRAALLESEFIFACNTFFLVTAFANKTYYYMFAYDNAFHGNVPYTFFDPATSTGNPDVAALLQGYITRFVASGDPGFPVYGASVTIRVINNTVPMDMPDPVANPRCEWLQMALYQ